MAKDAFQKRTKEKSAELMCSSFNVVHARQYLSFNHFTLNKEIKPLRRNGRITEFETLKEKEKYYEGKTTIKEQ